MKRIAIFLLMLLTAVFLFNSCGFSGSYYPDGQNYSVGDRVFSEEIAHVAVYWESGEVIVGTHDGQTTELSEKTVLQLADEERVHWMLDGDTLVIRYAASGVRYQKDTVRKTLHLTLPSSALPESLEVSSSSGEIHVDLPSSGIQSAVLSTTSGSVEASLANLEELLCETTSGSMDIIGENIRNCTFHATSGSIEAAFSNVDDMLCETTSGSMDIAGENIKNCTFSATSGNIKVTSCGIMEKLTADMTSGGLILSAAQTNTVDITSTSANVVLSFEKTPENCRVASTSGEIFLYLPQDAGFTAEIDTTSGDFSCDYALKKQEDRYICGEGDAEFRFSTTSGDIQLLNRK